MEESQTWREILGRIIKDPQERGGIARKLGIRSITLMRWVKGESEPRPDNVRRLGEAVQELSPVLLEAFPEYFLDVETDTPSLMIPPEFYASVLSACAQAPRVLRLSLICKLVLQQALEHLDPHFQDVVVLLVQCLPPSNGKKIRSLVGVTGVGMPPWGGKPDEQNQLFGAESFSGYVVSSGYPVLRPNTGEHAGWVPATVYVTQWPFSQHAEGYDSGVPPSFIKQVASEAGAPLKRGGRIAGCLHVCSSRSNAFLPSHLTLIQQYADLVALAFEPEDFYELQDIELCVMPPWWVQAPYLFDFRERVSRLIKEAERNQQSLNILQVEQMAWQQLEEKYIQLLSS